MHRGDGEVTPAEKIRKYLRAAETDMERTVSYPQMQIKAEAYIRQCGRLVEALLPLHESLAERECYVACSCQGLAEAALIEAAELCGR